MTFRYDGFNHMVRLEKGEPLIASLTKLINEQGIESAWVSGLGAAEWAEVGFYHLDKKEYEWQKISGPLEIIGLQGNIAWIGNKPVLHIHGMFSDAKMQTYAGHVKELEVAGTCEIFLHKWYDGKLTRSLDDETGLNLLDI